jgi:hypothetical protein
VSGVSPRLPQTFDRHSEGPYGQRVDFSCRLLVFGVAYLIALTLVFFMSLIIGHAYVRPVRLKCVAIAAPYVSTGTNSGSRFLIKLYHPVVLLMIGGDMLMATSPAFMGACVDLPDLVLQAGTRYWTARMKLHMCS